MKTRVVILAFIAAGFIFSSSAFSCPCHPCKCSPCTCGGMGGKSGGGSKSGGGKHHGDHHRGHDGGSSVGVGVSVDLSGVGHRTREADPFAQGGGNDKPVAHTEEKRTTKHKEHEPATTGFDEIKLTGVEGKGDMPPQDTFNVNNDEPPKTTDAATELKKAYDKYHNGRIEWLKKQPNYAKVMHDLTQSPNTDEGNRKANKAKKKFDKMIDEFNNGDGKDVVDDWKKAFDNQLKSGGTVDDNSMIPPPKDDIEKKKYAVIKAQNELNRLKKNYDDIRDNAANKDEEVKKARETLGGFSNTNDPGYKGALADLDKAVEKAGQKWAGTDEGKKEVQKVHDAEKDLDKAKEAWKPFEKYVEK